MTTEEQRIQMIELSNQGLTAPQVAEKLNCSVWTVRKWKQRFKKKRAYILKWSDQLLDAYLVSQPS